MSRTLVVGDVHACADELAALLRLAEPERVVLVGDVFNKGPDPDGTWALVQQWRADAVLGNHDEWVIGHPVKKGRRLAPEPARDWLRGLPLFLEGPGWLVVHAGIHPTLGRAGTTREMALELRRFPGAATDPFWWELYQGPGLVLYGHDAVRGLVDRRPQTLGLDTGCVYGGRLSGYLVEEDRILSVPAARVYKAVKG